MINQTNKNKTIKNKNTLIKNKTIKHKYGIPIANNNIFNTELNMIKSRIKYDYKAMGDIKHDFYTYVNHHWIKKETDIKILDKTYFTQYDNFRIKQNEVYDNLMELLDVYIKNNNNDITNELKNLYNSRIHENDEIFNKRIVEAINYVDSFIENNDFYGLLAYINRSDMTYIYSPIKWKMLPNVYDPQKYISTIILSDIPIYDIDIFVDNDNDTVERKNYKNTIRNTYKIDYLQKLFNKVNKLIPKSQHIDTNDIYNKGIYLAELVMESLTNDTNDNLVVTNEESKKLFDFDWELFAQKLGYKNIPKYFLVSNSSYLKLIMDELKTNWKSWRNWWVYTNIKFMLNVSDQYFPIFYNFYRKFIEGRGIVIPKKVIKFHGFCLCFNNLINNLYKENYVDYENISYTNQLSNDLKLVFIQILKNNKWLSPKSKQYAILKLQKIKIIIDSKPTLEKDPLLGYSKDDILLNFEKIYKWRLEKFIENDGKDLINLVDINWRTFIISGKETYLVNAFYISSLNEVYIPLALLQDPFVNLDERGKTYNLSSIGYIIAHELSHSLDNNGIKYGYDGKLVNWFTKKDYKILNDKFNNIKKQCKLFANLDNVNVNIDLIVDETISDISALEICQIYLINFLSVKDYYVPIGIPILRELYIYFAMNMRQLIQQKAYKYQLATNPHLMDKYRVNISLSRIPLFKEMYNIKKGDGMYWETTSIW